MNEVTTYVFACQPSDEDLWQLVDDVVGRIVSTLSADLATAMVERLALRGYRRPTAVPYSPFQLADLLLSRGVAPIDFEEAMIFIERAGEDTTPNDERAALVSKMVPGQTQGAVRC